MLRLTRRASPASGVSAWLGVPSALAEPAACALAPLGWLVMLLGSATAARAHDAFGIGFTLAGSRLQTVRYIGLDRNKPGAFASTEDVFTIRFTVRDGVAVSDDARFAARDGTFDPVGTEQGMAWLRLSFTAPLKIFAGGQFVPVEGSLNVREPVCDASARTPAQPVDLDAAPFLPLPVNPVNGLGASLQMSLAGPGGRMMPGGVYLAEVVANAPGTPFAPSAPFSLLLDFGRPAAEYDAARDAARGLHTPAPAAGLLLGALTLARRQRR